MAVKHHKLLKSHTIIKILHISIFSIFSICVDFSLFCWSKLMRLCVDPSLCLIVFITSNCYLPLLQCCLLPLSGFIAPWWLWGSLILKVHNHYSCVSISFCFSFVLCVCCRLRRAWDKELWKVIYYWWDYMMHSSWSKYSCFAVQCSELLEKIQKSHRCVVFVFAGSTCMGRFFELWFHSFTAISCYVMLLLILSSVS